jgi:hypothetical protein
MSYLRNGGIYSKEEYVGKTIDEARKYAEEGGFITRIVEEDGKSFMVTMDFKTERLNFRVLQGYITDVYGG